MLYRALEDVFPEDAGRVSPLLVPGAAALLAVAPLFSISGLRPLSDMPGLALALLAQALIVRGIASPWWLVAGAFIAGLSGGIRVQSAVLTVPLLLGALIGARRGHTWTHRALAVVAGLAGGLAWGIPLLVLSGGLQGYLRALGSQRAKTSRGWTCCGRTRRRACWRSRSIARWGCRGATRASGSWWRRSPRSARWWPW
jgi:hypothetical protein